MTGLLRPLAAALLAMAALAATPAGAEIDYPWCSRSSAGQGGGPSCRFTSYDQCYASVVSSNGWCERNARIVWQEQQAKRGAR